MSSSTPIKKKRKQHQITTPTNDGLNDSASQLRNPGDISLETIINSPFKKSASPFRGSPKSRNDDRMRALQTQNSKSDEIPNSQNNALSLSQHPQLLPPALNEFDISESNDTESYPEERGRLLQFSSTMTKATQQSLSPYRRVSPVRSPSRFSQVTESQKLELVQLSPNKLKYKMQQLNHSQKQNLSLSETNGKRMYISQLVLTNFKSYAGTQVVGPFHEDFTAIVGPNGSGKSNVIDSMLFVFGFRANKLRQGKLKELIHKSEAHLDLQYCSVEVHFKYKLDQAEALENADQEVGDLVITRKAFKNNTSKYYINNKESTYTEVTTLLKKEGIDLDHKRFLILQGEVESIAQMKPKAEKEGDDGVLEYLEDIIGTAHYKEDIESSIKEIEVLNEVCVEKENRFKIVESEKTSLETAKNSALEYIKNENELVVCTSKLYQYKIYKAKKKLDSTVQEFNTVEERLKDETAKYESYENDLNILKEKCSNYESDLKKMTIQQQSLTQKQSLLTKSKISNEEKLKSLQNKKKKSTSNLENVTKNIQKVEGTISDFNEEQLTMENELQGILKELKPEKAKLDIMKLKLKEETIDISKKIQAIEEELEPWTAKIQEIETSIILKKNEIQIIEQSKNSTQARIEECKQQIMDLNIKIDSNNTRLKKLNKELVAINKGLDLGTREVEKANKRISEMKEVLNIQRQKTMDARNSLTSIDNQNKVLSSLSSLQKMGKIKGFHGRLGDLGVIDEKYNVAISTACPRLNDIVVETVECGQQCIDYLRKNRLGYARFILLDKLRSFNLQKSSTPYDTPRLFDLIQTSNEIFLPAFYSVLRDTLVARDLKEANKVAYSTNKRYRVVTLDGKMIDISGTMSGGGKQMSKDLMRVIKTSNQNGQSDSTSATIFTHADVAELEKTLSARETSFQEAFGALQEMSSELNKLKSRKPDIETEISKIKFDNENYVSEISGLKIQIEELEQVFVNDKESAVGISNAQNELVNFESELQNAKAGAHSPNQEIQKLKEEILKIGGVELQLQNSKVDSFLQRIDILNSKMKTTKKSFKKKETELKKFKIALKDAEKDITNCETELEKIEFNLNAFCTDLDKVEKELEESLNQQEDIQAKFDEAKAEYDLKSTETMDFKFLEVELQNTLNNLKKIIDTINKKIDNSNAKLQDLRISDISNILELLKEEEKDNKEDNDVLMEETQDKQISHDDSQNSSTNLSDEMDIDSLETATLSELTSEVLDELDTEVIQSKIESLQTVLSETSVDTDVLMEYVERLKDFNIRKKDLNTAVAERDIIRDKCEILKKKRLDEFMEGFSIISLTLKEMYQLITMGGNAELELVDSLDPFSEGVLFSVMPPKKSWRNISNLSGGEKTLSSLALVFALHKYKPTPIYIMDEIDAALDFRNVSIVANYIKDRTQDAQFIVISLRNNMFELSEQLVGIYKNENMTKSTAIKNIDLLHV